MPRCQRSENPRVFYLLKRAWSKIYPYPAVTDLPVAIHICTAIVRSLPWIIILHLCNKLTDEWFLHTDKEPSGKPCRMEEDVKNKHPLQFNRTSVFLFLTNYPSHQHSFLPNIISSAVHMSVNGDDHESFNDTKSKLRETDAGNPEAVWRWSRRGFDSCIVGRRMKKGRPPEQGEEDDATNSRPLPDHPLDLRVARSSLRWVHNVSLTKVTDLCQGVSLVNFIRF